MPRKGNKKPNAQDDGASDASSTEFGIQRPENPVHIAETLNVTRASPATTITNPDIALHTELVVQLTGQFAHVLENIAERFTNKLDARETKKLDAKPPTDTFSGLDSDDPEWFLNQANEYFSLAQITDDKDRISFVESLLRDEALKWNGTNKRKRETYVEFERRFLTHYNSPERIAIATTMLYGDRHQHTEPVSEFITRKLDLFERISPDLPDETRANILLGQIDSEIRSRLRGVIFTNVERLRDAVVNVEKDIAESIEKGTFRSMNARNTRNTNLSAPQATPTNSNSQGQQQVTAAARPNNAKPLTACRYCSEWHYHSQCDKNPYRKVDGGITRPATNTSPPSQSKN